MAEPTVEDLSAAFGCQDDSYDMIISDYTQAFFTSGANLKKTPARRRIDKTSQLLNVLAEPTASNSATLARFSHEHLPAFLRAFHVSAALVLDSPTFDHSVFLLSTIASDPLPLPHFARYIRRETSQPSSLIKLMLVADAVLVDLNGRIEKSTPWKTGSSIAYPFNAHKMIKVVSSVIFLSSPPTSYTPEITSSAASTLGKSIQRLKTNITTQSAASDNNAQFASLREALYKEAANLASFLGGQCEHTPCVRLRKHWRDEQPWTSCAGSGLGECKEMEDGQEMMACGRCKQIRYCSPAHQKAHWKQHKKTCWEPIW